VPHAGKASTVWPRFSALFAVGIILFSAYSSLNDEIASLGFGAIHPSAMLRIGSSRSRIVVFIGCALCANVAQLVSSFLYLAYNGLFTCIHMAREYSAYAVRKPNQALIGMQMEGGAFKVLLSIE
jgi:hypothetical protein